MLLGECKIIIPIADLVHMPSKEAVAQRQARSAAAIRLKLISLHFFTQRKFVYCMLKLSIFKFFYHAILISELGTRNSDPGSISAFGRGHQCLY
jgi:hypothetical protein